jgi:hypothetical protein
MYGDGDRAVQADTEGGGAEVGAARNVCVPPRMMKFIMSGLLSIDGGEGDAKTSSFGSRDLQSSPLPPPFNQQKTRRIDDRWYAVV